MINERNLERNLCGVVQEMALKMGRLANGLSLNYPLKSLCRMLEANLTFPAMRAALDTFFAARTGLFGPVNIEPREGGFCLFIPPEGVSRVCRDTPPFLKELVAAAQTPGISLDGLLAVFRRHSPHVRVERVENAEFSYLVYFEDDAPDRFRYCIDAHDGFVSYHRYTKEDYEDFGL